MCGKKYRVHYGYPISYISSVKAIGKVHQSLAKMNIGSAESRKEQWLIKKRLETIASFRTVLILSMIQRMIYALQNVQTQA